MSSTRDNQIKRISYINIVVTVISGKVISVMDTEEAIKLTEYLKENRQSGTILFRLLDKTGLTSEEVDGVFSEEISNYLVGLLLNATQNSLTDVYWDTPIDEETDYDKVMADFTEKVFDIISLRSNNVTFHVSTKSGEVIRKMCELLLRKGSGSIKKLSFDCLGTSRNMTEKLLEVKKDIDYYTRISEHTKIRELSFHGYFIDGYADLPSLIIPYIKSSLVSLNLSRCNLKYAHFDTNFLSKLPRSTSLRKINLDYNTGVNESIVNQLVEKFPNLEYVSLNGCSLDFFVDQVIAPDTFIARISEMKTLRLRQARFCAEIVTMNMIERIMKATRLVRLDLRNCKYQFPYIVGWDVLLEKFEDVKSVRVLGFPLHHKSKRSRVQLKKLFDYLASGKNYIVTEKDGKEFKFLKLHTISLSMYNTDGYVRWFINKIQAVAENTDTTDKDLVSLSFDYKNYRYALNRNQIETLNNIMRDEIKTNIDFPVSLSISLNEEDDLIFDYIVDVLLPYVKTSRNLVGLNCNILRVSFDENLQGDKIKFRALLDVALSLRHNTRVKFLILENLFTPLEPEINEALGILCRDNTSLCRIGVSSPHNIVWDQQWLSNLKFNHTLEGLILVSNNDTRNFQEYPLERIEFIDVENCNFLNNNIPSIVSLNLSNTESNLGILSPEQKKLRNLNLSHVDLSKRGKIIKNLMETTRLESIVMKNCNFTDSDLWEIVNSRRFPEYLDLTENPVNLSMIIEGFLIHPTAPTSLFIDVPDTVMANSLSSVVKSRSSDMNIVYMGLHLDANMENLDSIVDTFATSHFTQLRYIELIVDGDGEKITFSDTILNNLAKNNRHLFVNSRTVVKG